MSKVVIKKLGVLSVAKMYAALMGIFGLIFGVIYGLIIILFGAAILSSGAREAAGAGAGSIIGGLAAMIGIPIFYAAMGFIGPAGFYWSLIGMHLAVAGFFAYRMAVWRSPFVKRPWDEVSLPARAFYVPATIVALGRRRRQPKQS